MRKVYVVLLVERVIRERAIDALNVSPVPHMKFSAKVKSPALSIVFASKPEDEPHLNYMSLFTAMQGIDFEISGSNEGTSLTSMKTLGPFIVI